MAIIYSLITAVAFTVSNIFFRLSAKGEKKLAALSSVYGFIGGLFFIPLVFLEGGPRVELVGESYLIILAIVGWAMFGYLIIRVNSKMEASTNALLSQTNTVFSFILGIILINSDVSWMKILGVMLIIAGNVLLFVGEAHISIDEAFWARMFLSFSLAFTYYFDNVASKHFSLGLYALITYMVPSIIIFIATRTKISDWADILKRRFWKVFTLSASGAIGYYFMIKAYSFDDISVVIPVVSSASVLTVLASGIFLGERKMLLKKTILAVVVFAGVVILGLTQ